VPLVFEGRLVCRIGGLADGAKGEIGDRSQEHVRGILRLSRDLQRNAAMNNKVCSERVTSAIHHQNVVKTGLAELEVRDHKRTIGRPGQRLTLIAPLIAKWRRTIGSGTQ